MKDADADDDLALKAEVKQFNKSGILAGLRGRETHSTSVEESLAHISLGKMK